MSADLENVIDITDLMLHLRTARNAYNAHHDHLKKVAEQGGIDDFMSAEAANMMANEHKLNAIAVDEMLDAIEEFFYGG